MLRTTHFDMIKQILQFLFVPGYYYFQKMASCRRLHLFKIYKALFAYVYKFTNHCLYLYVYNLQTTVDIVVYGYNLQIKAMSVKNYKSLFICLQFANYC